MNTQIQVAIVEDDFVIAKELQLSLQNVGYSAYQIFEKGEDFLTSLEQKKPDLVMLDIQLAGKMDGVDVAQQLSEKYTLPFIFLTAQSDLLTLERAKFTEPQAYLIKPFNIAELQATIEITLYKLAKHTEKTNLPAKEDDKNSFFLNNQLFVKNKNRLEKISLTDILRVEARDIYAIIKTSKSQYVVSHSLKTLESQLGDNFVRTHRSYLVALDKIEAIEDNSFIICGQYIPIGKTFKDELMKKLRIV